MSDSVKLFVLVEGFTEQKFVKESLAPFLLQKNIFATPIQVNKPGQKGGDVKFSRVMNDIRTHLKQSPDTYLTLMIDFYGLKTEWPGRIDAGKQPSPAQKAEFVNMATKSKIEELFPDFRPDIRFIPYVSMYEFEALLFSNPDILADSLHVKVAEVKRILNECKEPENINDSPDTAPSKRLERLSGHFKKTLTGTAIAKAIGIETMRAACPVFNKWLTALEELSGSSHGNT